jgi:hypothetical protein
MLFLIEAAKFTQSQKKFPTGCHASHHFLQIWVFYSLIDGEGILAS